MSIYPRRKGIKPKIGIGADGILRRVFPGLKPFSIYQKMSRFPIIVSLIAIGYI